MKNLSFLVVLLALFSCQNATESTTTIPDSVLVANLNAEQIEQKLFEIEKLQPVEKVSLAYIKAQITNYEPLGIIAIPIVEKIITKQFSALTVEEADSVYKLFDYLITDATFEFTDGIYNKYPIIIEKLDSNKDDKEVKAFKQSLALCGLSLQMVEGSYYVDLLPDYIFNIFKGKGTKALNEYLLIQQLELKEGYAEDGGMYISFDDLYKRIVLYEDFMAKFPDFYLNSDLTFRYTGYLSTLLTGMYNTPVFDYESLELLPELKVLYEKVSANTDSRNSTKIIKEYYLLLSKNSFKQLENTDDFLKTSGLM